MTETLSEIERQLSSLAEMRHRWRKSPEAVEMIDTALTMLTLLETLNEAEPAELLEDTALRLASCIRIALAKLGPIKA